MKQQSIRKNFVYSTFYQVLTLITPFITAVTGFVNQQTHIDAVMPCRIPALRLFFSPIHSSRTAK